MGTLWLVAPLDSDHVLTDPAHATPGWLTGVLRRNGVLRRGQVEAVNVVSRPTPQAGMARLGVRYTAGAGPTLPLPRVWRDGFTRWGDRHRSGLH